MKIVHKTIDVFVVVRCIVRWSGSSLDYRFLAFAFEIWTKVLRKTDHHPSLFSIDWLWYDECLICCSRFTNKIIEQKESAFFNIFNKPDIRYPNDGMFIPEPIDFIFVEIFSFLSVIKIKCIMIYSKKRPHSVDKKKPLKRIQ